MSLLFSPPSSTETRITCRWDLSPVTDFPDKCIAAFLTFRGLLPFRMVFLRWAGKMHIYHRTSTHADVDICLPNNFCPARSQFSLWLLPDLLLLIWNTFMMHSGRKCTGDKIHISTSDCAKTTNKSEGL